VVGRTVLLGVGLIGAFLAGLAGVVLLTGDERAAVDGAADEVVDEPRLTRGRGPAELPAATLEGFGGGDPVKLPDDYAGRPLVVNFWATWCPPCVEEMPDLQEMHERLGGEVAFLGVNVKDAPSNAEPFVEELGIGYDLAVDSAGEYYREVEAPGMPTTLLVDPEGRIAARHMGLLTAEELAELLAEELGVAP
jgi:thiol-disulfide isomerase/thioredoxin